jgi:hypothetical protein
LNAEKKIWPHFLRIIKLFTQKLFTKLSKIWVWDPGSEMRKKPIPDPGSRGQKGTGSRIRNTVRNHFFFKYFNSLMRIRDPGWKQFGSGIQDGNNLDPGWKKVGSGIRIRHKHPESATLLTNLECKVKKAQNTYHIPSCVSIFS